MKMRRNLYERITERPLSESCHKYVTTCLWLNTCEKPLYACVWHFRLYAHIYERHKEEETEEIPKRKLKRNMCICTCICVCQVE